MSNGSVERRIRRRSVHRSRSTAVAVALVVLALVAAWIGTEAVLSAIGRPPLVADPQTVVDTALRPDAAFVTVVEVIAGVLVVLGVVLVVLALKPGRQHRSVVEHERGAVVIDARIVASTAANAAGMAAGVPEGNASATARGRSTEVRIVPVTGVPVDEASVRAAVVERLSGLDERFGRRVRVRVEEKGTLA
ncbi:MULTISPECIES: DUF6286 domain-containing protein [Curtobacterium]|jgi:hypothetical protein|uniref:DUF6286 domain-containing protein n=1 Tax=Curtobacterium TaxID=2034 RepID=UPI000D9209CF|nr:MULTISPECIES: DUF6286 domain-containing protein [Curtobacterium]MBT1683108.1 hypothetical protein [Curtobacterium flaccumfaciens pv. flaccumfaciens]MCS6556928.1 DUF6286 domain-containing protein [Curtobacterium flaccumfaciens]MDO3697491.1 DUF6286 domain-containing protein [Curtobacterium flaccumfaciens]MDO3699526.1 DUF6286 domain-containing protein [Curtobacterium flaccumfaciens]PYY46346.1 hypothetical protein DEJ03_07620 [Curtobacterium sp. MCLR17_043]